ncbi:SDR family oxidoreductase [Amylibacter sp. SFDW26]|uniref:D-erythronate dehydrogenase n=1 Tax=Amylibacter sp. SFDW26 TaxID=2652722 RepID=UPI001261A97C|nr:D-erythronate dehydrogenase [Amylibacter sp. SFDW26]KAB7614659.1 SDR family oxidoreductase [Amylibacter sp. SFDW26]
MKVLILGGAGMIGQKLAHDIAANGLSGDTAHELILHDIITPPWNGKGSPTLLTGNISDPETSTALAASKPDLIYFLSAIVSGDAEANFAKGWDINMRSAWNLFEAIRAEHEASNGRYKPKVIFSSSLAVFSGPYPDTIPDDFFTAPQSSYGAQKAAVELLLADYVRKGFMDGFSMRLPTICVRPGKPNLAASSFYSSIIREPLNGQEAILPVPETLRHWFASPKSAVGFMTHAASISASQLGKHLSLNLPGVSCTVADQIEALHDIAGADVVKLIKREPNEAIQNIVMGWPERFAAKRALNLGFQADKDFKAIIQTYIDTELCHK